MNYNRRAKALLMGAFAATLWASAQQFTNVGGNGWWRTNPTTPNIGRGVAIGNLTATPYPAAFQIHGELMPAGNNTPEVFRTNAPTTGNTFWRMFQGGTTAGFERGQLFAEPANTNFNINAPSGNFLLHTQNVARARLNGNVTGPIGPTPGFQFPNINRDGFFALSGTADAFTNIASRAPFTRLHLVDNAVNPNDPVVYAQQHGFRPWQRNGVTFTGNSDQSYIGHRYAGNDNTDFVIQWSDNPNGSPWGTDRMKFVFTTEYNAAAPRGAATVEGLEAIRLWPRNNTEVNVGIGDFAPPAVGDPTERVDMLNGRLRIRELPSNPAATDSFYVMVVDRTTLTPTNQERGVVKWVPPSIFTGGSGAGCDWELQPSTNRMHTAWQAVGSTIGCPEADWAVGIGNNAPDFKLDVHHNENNGANGDYIGGIRSDYYVDDLGQGTSISARISPAGSGTLGGSTYGVNSEVAGAGHIGVGVSGRVLTKTIDGSATRMHGVLGTVVGPSDAGGILAEGRALDGFLTGGSTASRIVFAQGANIEVLASSQMDYVDGVSSWVRGGAPSVRRVGYAGKVQGENDGTATCYGAWLSAGGGTSNNFGVHATASGTGAWAGWFEGDVKITNTLTVNTTVYTSDGSLKTGIEPAPSCLPIINALQPKSYQFTAEASDALNLDSDQHVGLIAQDLETVLPTLVHEVNMPAKRDSLGNVLADEWSYKGVDYVALIPYLIGAVKELAAQNATMQARLATCCAASPTDSDQRMQQGGGAGSDAEGQLTPAQERLLRIAPNPFTDRTTLYCTLERAGRMQLLANSADGRDLRVLSEGQREAGEFQYAWSTEHLAPGVYYVTLLLDGEPVVKRAVKVGR